MKGTSVERDYKANWFSTFKSVMDFGGLMDKYIKNILNSEGVGSNEVLPWLC